MWRADVRVFLSGVGMVGYGHVGAAASRPGCPVSRRAEEACGRTAGSRVGAGGRDPAAARGERPAEGSAEETEAGLGRHGPGDRTGPVGQEHGAPWAPDPAAER